MCPILVHCDSISICALIEPNDKDQQRGVPINLRWNLWRPRGNMETQPHGNARRNVAVDAAQLFDQLHEFVGIGNAVFHRSAGRENLSGRDFVRFERQESAGI